MSARSTKARTRVAVVALLLACGQSLEGPRLVTLTVDGGGARAEAESIDSGWHAAFAAADIDRDGDDELLITATSIAAMQRDGETTTLLEASGERALWSPRSDGDSADLFVWSEYDPVVTHAACELTESPACSVAGTFETSRAIESIAVGDFDEDGRIDMVTSSHEAVDLRTSAGDDWRHSVWSEKMQLLYTASYDAAEVVATDLDADGHVDIAAAAGALGLRFFFGAGDGTFEQVRPSFNDRFGRVDGVQLAFLDADATPELVLRTDNAPVVLRRLRARTFGDTGLPTTKLYVAYDWDLEAVVGDFDGDERDELMFVHWYEGAWLANLDDESRDWSVRRVSESVEPTFPNTRVAADLDGDGRDALAFLVPEELGVECSIGAAPPR